MHRLPKPKTYRLGSFALQSKEPSSAMYRSGLNTSGSGYIAGSCVIPHTLPITMDPFGIRYPRYTSSSISRCGIPDGA